MLEKIVAHEVASHYFTAKKKNGNKRNIWFLQWKKILSLLSRISIVDLEKIVPHHSYKFLLSLQESSRGFYPNSRSFSCIIVGRPIWKISANKCKPKKIALVAIIPDKKYTLENYRC